MSAWRADGDVGLAGLGGGGGGGSEDTIIRIGTLLPVLCWFALRFLVSYKSRQ
jgi:hypothetical protein